MQSPATVAAYERALPDDPSIERKLMFGTPCAFVNRQMFFGTFEDTLVARVGPRRVGMLTAQGPMRAFTPSEGRTWDDYVQVDPDADPALLASLAAEAFAWTLELPSRAKPPKKERVKRAKRLPSLPESRD